jgi:hypothetical protein
LAAARGTLIWTSPGGGGQVEISLGELCRVVLIGIGFAGHLCTVSATDDRLDGLIQ